MENWLNFNLMLSLKEIALRRIGVAMCNKPSLFIKIVNLFGVNQRELGTSYHSDILDNMSNIRLPESLKKQMIPIIRAVCDEMARWKLFHEAYFDEDIYARLFRYLCWTTAGTINYEKTAELILSSDEFLDPEFRFQLACFYCLEDFIPALWEELPVESKKDFFDGDISQIKEPHLKLFLPKILDRAESQLSEHYFRYSPGQAIPGNSIELAACIGNKKLFHYYFTKLSKGEKDATLVRTTTTVLRFRDAMACYPFNVERNLLSSVSLHLLSLMTAEEQNRLFKEVPCQVIGCVLDWPMQDLFLDIPDVMWTFLPERKYSHLFRTLMRAFAYPDHCFRNLFHEFFQRSPVNFQKRFADGDCKSNRHFWLFISKDAGTIRVVLRNLDPADRVKFVFSKAGAFLIYNRQYDRPLMEVFFRELNLTKEEKRRLKEAVTEHAKRIGLIRWVKNNFGNFFEFVDEWEASAQRNRSLSLP